MAIKYLAGDRIIGTTAERVALTASIYNGGANTSWKELARTTLGSAGDDVDTGTFTAKDNLMVLLYIKSDSNGAYPTMVFNNDSSGNYSQRRSNNGGTDDSSTSASGFDFSVGGGTDGNYFAVFTISNQASREKLIIGHGVEQDSTGTSVVPDRGEFAAKWDNTSDQINRVNLHNSRADRNWVVGSEVVVLGCDDDEADSGTNFWEELSSTTLTSAATTINTGTFTAKKYLWTQMFFPSASGTADFRLRNGNTTIDTGSNYTIRYNLNGGSDASSAGGTEYDGTFNLNWANAGYSDTYIFNKADKEKLLITHRINAGAVGAGNTPARAEGVGKWVNTSAQINILEWFKSSSQTVPIGTTVKVWGHD